MLRKNLAVNPYCSPPVRFNASTLQRFNPVPFDPIRTLFLQKNSQFFPATFTGNHWQISEKSPKKCRQNTP
jgi:hypothetical protein